MAARPVAAKDCPRISPAFLAEERASLGPWFYGQEYECQFRAAAASSSAKRSCGRCSRPIQPLFARKEPWPTTPWLDLGKERDPSALVIAERIHFTRPAPLKVTHGDGYELLDAYQVRHIVRFELGTPYDAVVDEVARLMTTDRPARNPCWSSTAPESAARWPICSRARTCAASSAGVSGRSASPSRRGSGAVPVSTATTRPRPTRATSCSGCTCCWSEG